MRIGQRVRLLPNEEYGWPEEYGTVVGGVQPTGVCTVQVDEQYRDEDDYLGGKCLGDGMREVTLADLEVVEGDYVHCPFCGFVNGCNCENST